MNSTKTSRASRRRSAVVRSSARRSGVKVLVIPCSSDEEEQLSEKEIHDQNGDGAGDDGHRGGTTHAIRSARRAQAVEAGDQSDGKTEEEGLHHARAEVVERDGLDDAAEVEA